MEGILTPFFMTAFPLCRQIQPKSSPVQSSPVKQGSQLDDFRQKTSLISVSASPMAELSEPTHLVIR